MCSSDLNLTEGRWNLNRPKRQKCLPWGLKGGLEGEAGAKLLKIPTDAEYTDVNVSRHLVPAQAQVILHAGSGGGWGNPLERDPERVRWDVIEDMVSIDAARERYGVVFRPDMSVDLDATRTLRAASRHS